VIDLERLFIEDDAIVATGGLVAHEPVEDVTVNRVRIPDKRVAVPAGAC
jgi:hypothetical protein